MKTASKRPGLFARLGFGVSVILLGQYALAVGADPGTAVDNTATISYSVNSQPQTDVDSTTASFVVDRRVDFTVTRMGTALTPTNLGDTDGFLDFYVTNLSNGDLDFNLLFSQLVPADGPIYGAGTEDTGVDMNNVRIRVSAAPDPAGAPGTGADPLLTDPSYIDNLPEDRSIRVRIYADTPGALAAAAIAGLSLDVSAADPTGSAGAPGANLTESASWNAATVDNVFADNGNGALDNFETANDGFDIQAAQLTITKSAAVISDPINGATDPRAIPGAIIEYTITIDNSGGTAAATDISIADELDTDVVFQNGANNPYNGGSSNIVFDAGTASESFCDADDAGDTNGDGCSIGGAPLALTIAGRDSTGPLVPISVAAGAVVTVQFQVEIQ